MTNALPELRSLPPMCRHPGCTDEALATRGTYAYLCETHKLERRAQYGLAGRRQIHTNAEVVTEGSFTNRAKSLLPIAKRLDRATEVYRPARAEFASAVAAWKEAIAALVGSKMDQ